MIMTRTVTQMQLGHALYVGYLRVSSFRPLLNWYIQAAIRRTDIKTLARIIYKRGESLAVSYG